MVLRGLGVVCRLGSAGAAAHAGGQHPGRSAADLAAAGRAHAVRVDQVRDRCQTVSGGAWEWPEMEDTLTHLEDKEVLKRNN